jgi:hypothetical protein
MLPDKEKGTIFIDKLEKEKPRYLRDNLLVLKKHLPEYEPVYIKQALDFCLETDTYNSSQLAEITRHFKQEQERLTRAKAVMPDIIISSNIDSLCLTPPTSKISAYETIL